MARTKLLSVTIAAAVLAGCGQAAQDLSYTNPEWRDTVTKAVSFPLTQALTLRVGLGAGVSAPAADSAALQWLESRTNIKLEFVSLVDGGPVAGGGDPAAMQLGQVRDLQLGELIRSGRLPDIVPESSFDLDEETLRVLFVDMLEFPGLTPGFRKLVASAPRFRDGLISRLQAGDKLYTLGSYDPDRLTYAGVLAYRQDVFQARSLETGTWEAIRRSLQELKTAYPESRPFGGLYGTLVALMPSWFGSGYDPSHVVYFDNDTKAWRFGPYEAGFEEMTRFLAGLYQDGLLSPDMIVTREDPVPRDLSFDRAFMAPYTGLTGPYFGYLGEDYGRLTAEGAWDGKGAWVGSLPLPVLAGGGSPKVSTQRFSFAGDGWLIYNQSKHVGEAVALLDLLFADEASRVVALGAEGKVWQASGAKPVLLEPYGEAYRQGGPSALAREMIAAGISTAFPLRGLELSFVDAFGYPQGPSLRYLLGNDLARNRAGVDVYAENGLRIPTYDEAFMDQRLKYALALRTHIESQLAGFLMGQRDLSEYGAFREELRKMGADELLRVYSESATVGDPAVLAPM